MSWRRALKSIHSTYSSLPKNGLLVWRFSPTNISRYIAAISDPSDGYFTENIPNQCRQLATDGGHSRFASPIPTPSDQIDSCGCEFLIKSFI